MNYNRVFSPGTGRRFIFYSLVILLTAGIAYGDSADNLPWPLKAEPGISSSFCEFRPGHFHAGLDMKVYGVVGVPCLAVDDGFVSRIRTTHNGYGRALYLQLEDGRTAVYAHLDGFQRDVEEYIRARQHETAEFTQDVFIESDSLFRFKKGDVVAFAGRSGTKHPHLHFELRDEKQRPLNPLFGGITIEDHLPPTPVALTISPMDGSSTVEGDCQPRIWDRPIRRNDGVWGPRDQVGVSGRVGISIDVFDKTNASENLVAVYEIKMVVNGEERWLTRFDKFGFHESQQVEIERDYRMWRTGRGLYHRLYRAKGNTLGLSEGDGIIDCRDYDDFPIDVDITLTDAAGNETYVEIKLVPDEDADDDRLVTGEPMHLFEGLGSSEKIRVHVLDKYIRFSGPPGIEGFNLNGDLHVSLPAAHLEGGAVAVWNPPVDFQSIIEITAIDRHGNGVEKKEIVLHPVTPGKEHKVKSEDEKLVLDIPAGSVFDTTWLRIFPEPAYYIPGEVVSCLRVEPVDQPLANEITVMLQSDEIVENGDGWGIYYLDPKKGWLFLGNDRVGDYMAAETLSWELFGLVNDTDNPSVDIISPKPQGRYSNRNIQLKASIDDSTSGLSADGINVYMDGNKIPAEYDSPRDRILYKPWKPLGTGKHEFRVAIVDRVGNETVNTVQFFIE